MIGGEQKKVSGHPDRISLRPRVSTFIVYFIAVVGIIVIVYFIAIVSIIIVYFIAIVSFIVIHSFICFIIIAAIDLSRFLYIIKEDSEAAKKALQRLRGRLDVDDEMEEMKREKGKATEDAEKVYTIKMLLKDKSNHIPLAATVALQVRSPVQN